MSIGTSLGHHASIYRGQSCTNNVKISSQLTERRQMNVPWTENDERLRVIQNSLEIRT